MSKKLIKQFSLCFDKSPEEAVEYLRSKGIKVTWDWQERADAIKKHCFTVAKASSADLLQLFLTEITKSVESGTTFKDFKKSIKEKLQTAGFSKNAEGKAWHLETIYRTNTQSAYMAGRYLQQTEVEDTFPYGMFIAVLDNRTTDVCRDLNNKVVPMDDAFWQTHYPPLHYQCRSRVMTVDSTFLDKHEIKLSDGGKLAKHHPTADGFDNNPAAVWKPDLNKYDKILRDELRSELKKIPKTADEARKEKLFSNCSDEEFNNDWDEDERKALQGLIGKDKKLSKKQIIEIFGGRSDIDFGQIVVDASYSKDGKFLAVTIKSMHGTGRDGTFERQINFKNASVDHSYYKLNKTGAGSYKQTFLNQLEFYEYIGTDKIKRIRLNANIDVGCWAWGRYGFKIEDDPLKSAYSPLSKIMKAFKKGKSEKLKIAKMFDKDKYFFEAAKEFCKEYNIDIEDFKKKIVKERISWNGYFDLTDKEQVELGRNYAKKK